MEAFATTRYRCDHCRKSYARKGACATHEGWCHHNPANRACTTCKHFKPGNGFDPNECAIEWFASVYADHQGDGDLIMFERNCGGWEAVQPSE